MQNLTNNLESKTFSRQAAKDIASVDWVQTFRKHLGVETMNDVKDFMLETLREHRKASGGKQWLEVDPHSKEKGQQNNVRIPYESIQDYIPADWMALRQAGYFFELFPSHNGVSTMWMHVSDEYAGKKGKRELRVLFTSGDQDLPVQQELFADLES